MPESEATRQPAESVVGILRDILAMTRVAGNGGYVADIGPVTYGRMVRLVEEHDSPDAICSVCGTNWGARLYDAQRCCARRP